MENDNDWRQTILDYLRGGALPNDKSQVWKLQYRETKDKGLTQEVIQQFDHCYIAYENQRRIRSSKKLWKASVESMKEGILWHFK